MPLHTGPAPFPSQSLFSSSGGKLKKNSKKRKKRTDAVHAELNLRTHDLVPAIDAPYQPPAALEAARAAEWMREGGRRREVRFEGFALGGGWGLG